MTTSKKTEPEPMDPAAFGEDLNNLPPDVRDAVLTGVYPPPAIYAAMVAVMKDIGAVGKDQQNRQQGYRFRGIDQVYNALHPALVRNGVFFMPSVVDNRHEAITSPKGTPGWRVIVTMRFTFAATDGSTVSVTTVGEAIDYADKATSQAMTVALKYALFQTFCIPTAEESGQEPDSRTPDSAKPQTTAPEHQPPTTKQVAMYRAKANELADRMGDDESKEWMKGYYKAHNLPAVEPPKLTKRQLSALLDEILAKIDEEACPL